MKVTIDTGMATHHYEITKWRDVIKLVTDIYNELYVEDKDFELL